MTKENIYKIAIFSFLHDIGKFAERGDMNVSPEFINSHADLYQPFFDGRHTHKHAVYTAAFIDHIKELLPVEFHKDNWSKTDDLMNLAARHHKPETPLQWVIAMADRTSSGFDKEEFEDYNHEINVQDYQKTRLHTIFEGITTDEELKEDPPVSYRYRYPLKELSPTNIFPVKSDQLNDTQTSVEYKELFKNFVDALKLLEHKQDMPLWFDHFDSLCMVYTSYIPAASVGRMVPDVSLYDHSKATAALASSIYLYHLQNDSMDVESIRNYADKKFLIVSGDFYGIQNFIFTEGGSTNKAAAKLLRGRSFAVSLISELAADLLCREIGLTSCSIIANAAGKFSIIAANTEQTKNSVKNIEKRINDWLINTFYGEASLGISFIDASCEDFVSNRFDALWDRLNKNSEKNKYKKINLNEYGGVVEGYLDHFNNTLSNALCPFCGKRPSSPEVENDKLIKGESACKICRDHIYLGTHLVKADSIAITTTDAEINDNKLYEPIFNEYQVSLDTNRKLTGLSDKGTLLKYWYISISKNGSVAKDITVNLINGYVPKYSEDDENEENLNRLLYGNKTNEKKVELVEMIKSNLPKSFHHIAKWALRPDDKPDKFTGTEALGILKADIDNLGLIFACGLKHNCLSKMSTLSRQMNHFFSIFLPYTLSKNELFENIYTVFAGGDDIFLIGPWNRIVEFTVFLKNIFSEYVSNNGQITLSAGISLNKPGEPVKTIVEMAENALAKAKGNEINSTDKNSITVFGETVKWESFEKLCEIRKTIETWLAKQYINMAMLYRLINFSDMSEQEKVILKAECSIDMEEYECLKWRARFRYEITRNVGKVLNSIEKNEALREVEQAADWIATYGSKMKIPIWQIIYNQR